MSAGKSTVPSTCPQGGVQYIADVNINDFQDKFAGYGIYRFQNMPTNQKEN